MNDFRSFSKDQFKFIWYSEDYADFIFDYFIKILYVLLEYFCQTDLPEKHYVLFYAFVLCHLSLCSDFN